MIKAFSSELVALLFEELLKTFNIALLFFRNCCLKLCSTLLLSKFLISLELDPLEFLLCLSCTILGLLVNATCIRLNFVLRILHTLFECPSLLLECERLLTKRSFPL